MAGPDDDLAFDALSFGLTVGQYRDAVRLGDTEGDVTRTTRCMALYLKYPPETVVDIAKCVAQLRA